MVKSEFSPAEAAVRRLSRIAFAIVLVAGSGIGVLAATTKISGAVIAAGTLVVDSYVKPVQHLKGGIVDRVAVKNGDAVKAGDLLVHLEDTQIKANLGVVTKRSNELMARMARLRAEQDGRNSIEFPPELLAQSNHDAVIDMISGEERLFAERSASRAGRKMQLHEQIDQLNQQCEGLEAQVASRRRQIEFINKELEGQHKLLDQGIVSVSRVYALEREGSSLSGELGSFLAKIAETKGKISETQLQIIQIDDDRRSEVSDQLRQAESDAGEYAERMIVAEDELKRIDIRAPQGGIVHQLAVHVRGAVIAPGETVAQIVPDADVLTAEIKLSPRDIDQVAIGQTVVLRFSAFAQPGTPDVNGEISQVSADLTVDQHSNSSFYLVRVKIAPEEWQRLGRRAVPGMPIEAFIQTGSQPAFAYFAKPLTDQIHRAFKEE